MAYNISETSGNSTGSGTSGLDVWTFDAALSDVTVTGNFDEDTNNDGVGNGETPGGYSFSALSTSAYGTLSFNTSTGQFTFTINKAAVIASGSDQTVRFTVTGSSGLTQDADQVVINIAICVQRGTRIKTMQGCMAVEDLEIGDRILTLDSGYQPIRWIGSRLIGRDELDLSPELRPIRFRAGALGPDMPDQDLLVSPQHRVLMSGWKAELHFGHSEILVPAKSLVNDRDITIDHEIEALEYFHVLFDQHEIMLTNGVATESFFPGDYVLDELASPVREELGKIFPELIANPDEFGSSARLCIKPAVATVLQHAATP